ncbi:HAMP domain-containing sensor histidine kinase [Thioalkalicoccus limnaeus]|uniref:histidine kinase n=1 Tax=Thioalkalicoccus limnaeus TaxID=120681 RepID=A0ABV4BJ46_9GAMM
MTRLRDLARRSDVRLMAFFAAVFALSMAVVGALVLWGVGLSLERQLQAHVESDLAQLLGDYRDDGLEELRHDIRERIEANPSSRLRYVLINPAGRAIFDPVRYADRDGWQAAQTADGRELLLFCTALEAGYRLCVGADRGPAQEMTQALSRMLLTVFFVTLAVGVGGGTVVSRRFLRRVERLKRVAQAIGEESLSLRIPIGREQDAFAQLAATINQMLDRIERLMSEVRQVSTNIAHDLRTPLGRLRQKLERMQALPLPAEAATLADAALTELDQILGLFGSLLRLAEIESGNAALNREWIEVGPLLQELDELYQPIVQDKGQTLALEIPAPVRVLADRRLLVQLLVNLLENAIGHTGPGTPIRLGAHQQGARTLLWVADAGPGIPAPERARVTQPFYRLDRGRSSPGHGLGLSLVAAIAARHGASIELADAHPGLRVTVAFAEPTASAGPLDPFDSRRPRHPR